MKTFNRTSLPESIKYNGETYIRDNTNIYANDGIYRQIQTLKASGKKVIQVNVLSRNLKGKTSTFNKPYEPTKWLYTTKKC